MTRTLPKVSGWFAGWRLPRWWVVVVYLFMLAGMLALGRWQLLRAQEKIALLDRAAIARAATPIDVRALLDESDAALAASQYRRVMAQGRWLPAQQFLWDNRAHAARPGVEIITPLQLDDGRLLLVNRGWQPLAMRRDALPDLSLAADRMTIDGLFSQPSQGFASGTAFLAGAPWPRYLQYFDYPAIQAALGTTLIPGVLQPSDDVRGAWRYEPNWQAAASGPGKHYSYALQWFAMAFALSVIFVIVNRRRSDRPHTWPDHPETR